MSDTEFPVDRDQSLNNQFLCWFGELNSSRQLIYTALSLQNISSDYLKLVHSLITYRLSEDFHHNNTASKANDIDHLNSLDHSADDFAATVLELLFSLDVSKERTTELTQIHDKYLSLVDKALENASLQNLVFDDVCDSLEGQLLIAAMVTPLFTLEDRQWLQKNLRVRCESSNSWQSSGLLNLINDLFEVFELHRGSSEGFLCPLRGSLSRNVRSSSINSPSFLLRSLYPYPNRRHHSLVPPTSENSLIVPSPFTMPHPFSSSSSSSPNSSGFVSGSESMYQGLNEPTALGIRGNRLAAPSNSRLYLLRRQSASPYTPQEGELKEEEDNTSTTAESSTKQDMSSSCASLLIPARDESLRSRMEPPEEMVLDMGMRHMENPSMPCLTVASPPVSRVPSSPGVPNTSPTPPPPPPPQTICEETTEQIHRPPVSKDSQKMTVRSKASSFRDEQFEDPGMAQVPVWLKSLRLHKYISLFKRLTYYQMLGITDEWLQHQHVTQGARNKILMSIANLSTRSTSLINLEAVIEASIQNPTVRASNIRGCLCELRNILQTPFPPSPSQPSATSPQHCLSPTSSLEDTNFMFGSDVEDFVVDDEGDFDDFHPSSGSLCQCPCTNSDTCLFDRSGVSLHSPRRPKSSEGGASASAAAAEIEAVNFFSNATSRNPQGMSAGPLETSEEVALTSKEVVGEDNLAEQIMRCLNHGFKALLCEPVDNDDNYGFFMQLLSIVLDHPSFSRIQKDQVISWQKEMVDRLGPAPPAPRRSSYHHHRATSRRSYQYSSHQAAVERGGSHSVPYTPRSSVVCGSSCGYVSSRPYFTAPIRMPYLQPQPQQQTPHSTFLQAPSPFGAGARWNVGIVRGRSAEPDVYHQGLPLRATFHEQQAVASSAASSVIATTHCGQQQHQRVASMDSLTVVSTPYGLMEPYATSQHPLLVRSRLISCHDPQGSSDFSTSVSPFASPELQSAAAASCCFNLLSPPPQGGRVSESFLSPLSGSQIQSPPSSSHSTGQWLGRPGSISSVMSEYSTAEINRDLELLTEKVTKLAIEESDSPSE
ncbi:hypothetical protein Aperf_G00000043065 [Anoplocephala perfoliata]